MSAGRGFAVGRGVSSGAGAGGVSSSGDASLTTASSSSSAAPVAARAAPPFGSAAVGVAGSSAVAAAPPSSGARLSLSMFKATQYDVEERRADELWKKLESAFHCIFQANSARLSFEELYRTAYTLVIGKHGDRLYQGVTEVLKAYLKERHAELVVHRDSPVLIQQLNDRWSRYTFFLKVIRDILMYLDRNYATPRQIPTIYDLGLRLFQNEVMLMSPVRETVRTTMLAWIARERRGEAIEHLAMKSMCGILIDVGIGKNVTYREEFEKPMLVETEQFYRNESQELLASNTCVEYLRKAAARRDQERQRVKNCMDESSMAPLLAVVETEMIGRHLDGLLSASNQGLLWILANNMLDDLHTMYTLFFNIPMAVARMIEAVCSYLMTRGEQIVNDPRNLQKPEQFIAELLLLHRQFQDVVQRGLNKDQRAQSEVRFCFNKIVNMSKHSSEFLSLYLDELMRMRVKSLSDEELDRTMEEVLVVFRFLHDKDVFERFYKLHLSRRLLQGRSASEDAEYLVILKFKDECGFSFTSKLEKMLKDIKLSEELNNKFKAHAQQALIDLRGIELNVKILTNGTWPSQSAGTCRLPEDVEGAMKEFERFYLKEHSSRRLQWHTNMGFADVRALTGEKKVELNVSTFQMAILMLFNKRDSYTVAEIAQETQVPEVDLRRHLFSLCTTKLPVLKCSVSVETGSVPSSAVVSWNPEFRSRTYRVKVPLLREVRDVEKPAEVPEEVLVQRRGVMDAAIVRIMKARKRMEHSLLIADVMSQVQRYFVPQPLEIKRRIESLIEREYLQRSSADRRVYEYLA